MSGTDISQYASTSASEPEESLDYLSDEETRKLEKCPICLVSPFTYVMTLCRHKFCLRCMLKMWESENSESESFFLLFFPFSVQFSDERVEWIPFLCPICREVVTLLSWTSTAAPIPQELRNYNSLYRNGDSGYSRRTVPSRRPWIVSFLVYLLVFIQLMPFLSTRFTLRSTALSKNFKTKKSETEKDFYPF